jgi:hypothetical protein
MPPLPMPLLTLPMLFDAIDIDTPLPFAAASGVRHARRHFITPLRIAFIF